MKINKETDNKSQEKKEGTVDTARMNVQCHILIKDKDTKKDLVNKRG
jgi:hypothetical protein